MCGEAEVVRKILIQTRLSLTIQQRKNIVLASLALLCALMMGVGIYYRQYFVVFVFCVWLCAEALLLRLQPLLRWSVKKTLYRKENNEEENLWQLYHESNEHSDTLSGIKSSELLGINPTDEQKKWVIQFRTLSQLKLLADSEIELRGKKGIQQCFVFQGGSRNKVFSSESGKSLEIKNTQDVIEAAVTVTDLLIRTQRIAETEEGRVGKEARALIEKILGFSFDSVRSRAFIDKLTDSIQRQSGIPFLILNLLHLRFYEKARELGRAILANELDVEEDLRSTLYWIAEVEWFSKEKHKEILDHDSAIRHLYHLCFTNPDRAGFLELDSQFSSEFGPINEIVEEGFLFKETLVEALLELWETYEGWFDGVFQSSLESMTGRKSKIYDERPNWMRYWRQEKDQFSRDYLYVIEGNLCYAAGQIKDAQFCYEKAVEISPELRSALFNLLMVSAELKDHEAHGNAKQQILNEEEWMPLALSSIGNSYFLLNDEENAQKYYGELRNYKGWEKKTDFYISVFCFDRGFFDKALSFAIKAHELNPTDSSISFHLSRCYSVTGEKEVALQVFKKAQGTVAPEQIFGESSWLNFYQFTLERDSGRSEEAVKTLLKIPKEYFQDSEELEAALEFAKNRKDLSLLRHLKQFQV